MEYNNFNDNLKLLKDKINNLTICVYGIENGEEILENRKSIGEKIKKFILNKKEEDDIDGISIKLNNFHGCDITLEELKNRSIINSNLYGSVKDYGKNVIPNFDNVIAVAICEVKAKEYSDINNKSSVKLVVVSKQIESTKSINEKLDKILDYNLKSNMFSTIYVKSCEELLNDHQFEKRFDELNTLENNLIAKDISNSIGINLKNKPVTNITTDLNKIPDSDYSFNLKKYSISNTKLITHENKDRFLVSEGDIIPLFTDPVYGIKLMKSKAIKDISFDMFLHNNGNNSNSDKKIEEKIKKKCEKLNYNFSIDMINENRNNHIKFSRNSEELISLSIVPRIRI